MGFFFDERIAQPAAQQADFTKALMAGIKAAGHGGIHNFSYGALATYFRLGTLPEADVRFNGRILSLSGLPGSARRKVFVMDDQALQPGDMDVLRGLQAESAIYSKAKLVLPGGSKFKELCYDLEEVFSVTSYPNSKKRHQRLVYPSARFRREGYVAHIQRGQAGSTLIAEIEELHRAWVAHKLADPRTMRTMFPKARYLNCAKIAGADPENYRMLGARDRDGNLRACRVFYVEGEWAFDLAFFSRFWDSYSNMTEDFNFACMAALHMTGVRFLNSGASLHKNLSAFKSHYPCSDVISWAYSKQR